MHLSTKLLNSTVIGSGVANRSPLQSIWADIAFTIGKHLYERLYPESGEVHMNVSNMEVFESQIPHNDNGTNAAPQLFEVEGLLDLAQSSTAIKWYKVGPDGTRSNHAFASTIVYYEDLKTWKSQWRKTTHLLTERIATLSQLAAAGLANKLSRSMVYQLFRNVVDYSDRYQGMQYVVLHELEAFSEIELVPDRHGSWHTPPHWIDSVFQMAGFVMNGSDVTNTRDFFYITPGWDALRLAKPLEASQPYQSYVRMFPSENEPNTFVGDIYALQSGEVVGVCEGIKFRKIPRVLMSHLFSGAGKQPPSSHVAPEKVAKSSGQNPKRPKDYSSPSQHMVVEPATDHGQHSVPESGTVQSITEPFSDQMPKHDQGSGLPRPQKGSNETIKSEVVINSLALVARETGINVKDITDDASFTEMGIDSLMSLVLSEKLLREVGVEVKSSTFLECPTVGEFTEWLTQYH